MEEYYDVKGLQAAFEALSKGPGPQTKEELEGDFIFALNSLVYLLPCLSYHEWREVDQLTTTLRRMYHEALYE